MMECGWIARGGSLMLLWTSVDMYYISPALSVVKTLYVYIKFSHGPWHYQHLMQFAMAEYSEYYTPFIAADLTVPN